RLIETNYRLMHVHLQYSYDYCRSRTPVLALLCQIAEPQRDPAGGSSASDCLSLGTSRMRRWVYGSAGCSRTCSTRPDSATVPWRRTTADWAMLRTRARLCVMKTRARCRSAWI